MVSEISFKILKNYCINYLKVRFQKNPVLKPLFFTYYATLLCNFNCSYCGYARSGLNHKKHKQLNTEDTIRMMKIILKSCPYIYFTRGEPLLRKDIVTVAESCKDMGFKSISINTNMSLIHKKMHILDHITNLVASFDLTDDNRNAEVVGMPVSVAKKVKENIITCAKLQKEKKFLMTINCVVTENSIDEARKVMQFCMKHNIRFAIVPAEMDNGNINPALKGNHEYQKLVKDIIAQKEKGEKIFGSKAYLDTIIDFKRFDCYPTLTPHIYPNGELFYPCQPLNKIGANLLQIGDYEKALEIGIRKNGSLPMCKDKCHKSCYIEPSNFINNPLLIIREFL